jgi:hypothetical protein
MSQLRLVVSQNSNPNSPLSKLDGVTCRMLPARSSESLFLTKARQLEAARPHAAAFIERLLDDLLADG